MVKFKMDNIGNVNKLDGMDIFASIDSLETNSERLDMFIRFKLYQGFDVLDDGDEDIIHVLQKGKVVVTSLDMTIYGEFNITPIIYPDRLFIKTESTAINIHLDRINEIIYSEINDIFIINTIDSAFIIIYNDSDDVI